MPKPKFDFFREISVILAGDFTFNVSLFLIKEYYFKRENISLIENFAPQTNSSEAP